MNESSEENKMESNDKDGGGSGGRTGMTSGRGGGMVSARGRGRFNSDSQDTGGRGGNHIPKKGVIQTQRTII